MAWLQLQGIHKSFGPVAALRPIDFELDSGEILGLVGENGAGKSTLIKLLSGIHRPDGGTIRLAGREVRFHSPADALAQGIATIHQELGGLGRLSVAENMLLGDAWPRYRWGGICWPKLYSQAGAMLERFGLTIRPEALLDQLSSVERQEVAIACALARQARLLILDEPTASLGDPEAQRLAAQLRRLQQQGVAIIYVSHRLDEVLAIALRIAVLRDGQLVALHRTAEVDAHRLVLDMLGRPVEQIYPHQRRAAPGPVLLELQHATCAGWFRDVSLRLRAGEVLGLGGLVGSGRSELARAIYGLYPLDGGSMRLAGRAWQPRSPRQALRAGLAYLPEERQRQGFALDHSLRDSISIGWSDVLARFGWIPRRKEQSRVQAALQTYAIRAPGIAQPVGALSGGNQQKALLARWLERNPQVILLDEPTRGVDIGAKAEIHLLIDRLAASGRAVLLISSDLPELLGMSDRIVVLDRGRVAAELSGHKMTERNVMLAASGLAAAPAQDQQ